MKKIFTSIVLSMLFCQVLWAQNPLPKRICAAHDHEHQHILDKYQAGEISEHFFNAKKADNDTTYSVPVVNTDTTYTIKVVFHVVYLNDNKYENPSDAILQSQIDALNRDFNLENDLGIIRDEFKQFIGNPKIKFELATVDPNGKPTTGINRKKSSPILIPDWNNLLDNIKNSATGGISPWKPVEYLNIWVCDLNITRRIKKDTVATKPDEGMLGGYANPPQGLPNWSLSGTDLAITPVFKQGVVIDFRFIGQYNEYNKDYFKNSGIYGLGRTTVHEVGHYLGLRHIWGDGQAYQLLFPNLDVCNDFDDGIKDTPSAEEPYANHIESSANLCGVDVNSCNVPYPGDGIDYPDMRENYMDYATDLCYAMFTKEQVNMMRYVLTEKRPGIITKREVVPAVPTGINNHILLAANIHPNPTKDIINVRFAETSNVESRIQIFNTLGQYIHQEILPANAKESSIKVDHLAPGSYIIHIERSGESLTQQFIKM